MRALVRRGLLVLLDLTNSSRELLLSPREGVGPTELAKAISRLAYAFAQQEAETVAFTGDGLLAFLPDTGRPQWLKWALTDALRDALHSTSSNSLSLRVPVGLRIAIDYGEALQVLDGLLAGHFVGRSVARLDDIAEAARPVEDDPRAPAAALVTDSVRQLLGLETHQALACSPKARHFSCRTQFHLWEMPYLTARAHQFRTDTILPPVERHGLVLCMTLLPAVAGPVFPPLYGDYLEIMAGLVRLATLCGTEVISLTPTAVFAFIDPAKGAPQHLRSCLETLFGRAHRPGAPTARALLTEAHQRGWHGLGLAAGLAYGPISQLANGPLVGQTIGRPVVLAGRYATLAANRLPPDGRQRLALALPLSEPDQSPEKDRAGAKWLWDRVDLVRAIGGGYCCTTAGTGRNRPRLDEVRQAPEGLEEWASRPLPLKHSVSELLKEDAKNLYAIGYRNALVLTA